MDTVLDRFLRYVRFDTQSDEFSDTCPSTSKQMTFGAALVEELTALGMEGARMDEHGYVYAFLPATPGLEDKPGLGLIAHMDTSPSVSGTHVNPRVVRYTGQDLELGHGVWLKPSEFECLARYSGKELVVADGSTLLGADDKAGVAEIVSAAAHLLRHPEIPHRRLSVAFTPDEEIGRGADRFDVKGFGAAAAYTVDGGELGGLEYETFNAASAKFTVHGVNIHPGGAKNKMKNASLMAMELANMLPQADTPSHTAGYEGFYHLCAMEGDETTAILRYIVRDHSRESFHRRKEFLHLVADFLNGKYGPGTVELELRDTYYNMRDVLKPHMHLIRRAEDAFRACGVDPVTEPIRGGTDGSRLSFMGLPCPNLSTGGLNFHGVHEFIPVFALEKMVEVLVALVWEEE